ncbi:MAG: 2-dehydropantoate 2-reductase [Myxococcota bacterium]|nr:2-dehydropantoate 2-reductase [Myxococcota bacterium]
MKIGIIGAGLIGGYLGARLAAQGFPVTLIGRAGFCDEVRAHGLRAVNPRGHESKVAPGEVTVSTDPAALRGCDWVLVTVKSAQTAQVAEQLVPVLDGASRVVSFQNGVRNPDTLRARLEDRVLAGMVPFNVVRDPSGAYRQTTAGTLRVERRDKVEELVAAFNRAGLETRSDPRILEIQWGKLLLNLNNAINALSDRPLREELLDPGYRELLARCIEEGLTLSKGLGLRPRLDKPLPAAWVPRLLRLSTPLFRAVAGSMLRIDPQARSSMWEDLSRGKPTEIDFLNGEIAQRARAMGLPAPVNAAIVQLVRQAEGKTSPALSSAALLEATCALNLHSES